MVTLYVRVWIETKMGKVRPFLRCVTLYVRVWIETEQMEHRTME